MNVPQVTELRRQLRDGEGELQGRQEHASPSARSRARSFEPLEKYFEGTTAIAYTDDRSGRARQDADDVRRRRRRRCTIKAAVVQGRAIKPAEVDRPGRAAGQAGAVREAALRAAGADGADRQRAERGAARSDERAGAGGKEATGQRRHARPRQTN